MTELTVKLPEELARQVSAAGLLEQTAIEAVFREALRMRASGELLAAMNEIHALGLPTLSERELQEEIDAVRAERRTRAAG